MTQKHRRGKGGSKGGHYKAGPGDLRSFEQPPAGPVTVCRADDTTEEIPPLPPKMSASPARRRRKRKQ